MDPHAVLGVAPGASARQVADAYRTQAKRWHPDRGGGAEAQRRMAEINVAFDALRAQGRQRHVAPPSARRAPAVAGAWLDAGIRGALGPALVAALHRGEPVAFVTPAATWAAPESVLAVTDRRLLWMSTHAISTRVHALRFDDVEAVEHRTRRPLHRVGVLVVRTTTGRRLTFSELRPETAAAIAHHVASARPVAERRAS